MKTRVGAIVGTGRLGRLLAVQCGVPGRRHYSGRDLLAKRDLADVFDADVACVVHAAGPAGEQACREDPGLAFALHYTLTERLLRWADDGPARRVVLLGTVAPNVGFYGPLKRAAVDRALDLAPNHATAEVLTVIECGHVIGQGLPLQDRNAGVVTRFVVGALTGRPLQLAGGGAQQLRYTPVSTLVTCLGRCLDAAPEAVTLSPVSDPVTVIDVARMAIRLADVLWGVNRATMVQTAASAAPDYAAPTGAPVRVPALSDVLIPWMRTVEAKVLLGVR